MIKVSLYSLFVVCSLTTMFAQDNSIYVFDFTTGILDSIPLTDFDPTLTEATTPYNIGNYNSTVALLSETPPTENVYPESQFTLKEPISEDFNVTDYPIRTTVKIWDVSDGSNSSICSGTMISKRHVLTATFCAVSVGTNDIYVDSLSICPIYNNGQINPDFACVGVTKVYFLKDWNLQEGAAAILELEEPVGEETGWVGIGYNASEVVFEDGIFYRFSYPSVHFPELDPNDYNGDTIYYGYGKPNIFQPAFVGVGGSFGIPGEDGTSIIKVNYNSEYISYGTMTWSTATRHSKLTSWSFQSFQNIIEDDLVLGIQYDELKMNLTVWPNPVTSIINIEGVNMQEIIGLSVFNAAGQKLTLGLNNLNSNGKLDVNGLPSGLYFINIHTKSGVTSTKFVKV